MATITLEHVDPRNGELVCGLCNEFNEILADSSYNSRKTNRFVPYRICEYPAPVTFGDVGEFLIGGEWTVCEFGGFEWWAESNKIGNSCVTSGRSNTPNQTEMRARNVALMNSHENTSKVRRDNGERNFQLLNSHENTGRTRKKNGERSGKESVVKKRGIFDPNNKNRVEEGRRKSTSTTKKKLSRPVMCVETGESYPSASEAGRRTGMRQGNISSSALSEGRKSVRGTHWVYLDNTLL